MYIPYKKMSRTSLKFARLKLSDIKKGEDWLTIMCHKLQTVIYAHDR